MNKLKLIICATLGNCFEIYDFIIYQLLSNHISIHFFDKNYKYAFLLTQIIFILTTILSRPIGGLIFGYIADTQGRKLSLEKAILLSGISTGMIGLIPSFEHIGFLSTLLLIFLRFLQGISLGGEQGTSISFLLEHSSPKTKGFLSSFCCFGQQLGILIAVTTISIYALNFTATNVTENSWRIIFILSFFFGFFGYWIRKKTNETIDFLVDNYCNTKDVSLLQETKCFIFNNKKLFFSIFPLVAFGTFITYTVFIIGNSYLKQQSSYLAIFKYIQYIMSFSIILSIPLFGYLSDKIGRKAIISHSILIISALSIPFFQAIESTANYSTLISAILLAISCGAYFSVTPTIVAESLPVRARCLNYAIFYTIPAAIISGITPFLSNWFIKIDPLYIFYTIIFLASYAIIALKYIEEPTIIYNNLDQYSYEFLKP